MKNYFVKRPVCSGLHELLKNSLQVRLDEDWDSMAKTGSGS